jgi:hypothetical protein
MRTKPEFKVPVHTTRQSEKHGLLFEYFLRNFFLVTFVEIRVRRFSARHKTSCEEEEEEEEDGSSDSADITELVKKKNKKKMGLQIQRTSQNL